MNHQSSISSLTSCDCFTFTDCMSESELIGHEHIYFVQPVNGGLIKIGYSWNPRMRLSSLQTGSPLRLRIIASAIGGRDEETVIKRHFRHLREYGEWHRPEAELLSYIQCVRGAA